MIVRPNGGLDESGIAKRWEATGQIEIGHTWMKVSSGNGGGGDERENHTESVSQSYL